MKAICIREFISLFKSVKSIIIILVVFNVSYFSAKYIGIFIQQLNGGETTNIYSGGLSFLILMLGLLFVTSLSHDTVNREIQNRTIRFLVTKTSRTSILFGKFLGIFLFWLSCMMVSFILISIFSKSFDWIIFLQVMSMLTYMISMTLLLSVLIEKPGLTMFLGIVLGLAFPFLNLWVMFTSKPAISWLKYLAPYFYVEKDHFLFLIILLFAAGMLLVADVALRRRNF